VSNAAGASLFGNGPSATAQRHPGQPCQSHHGDELRKGNQFGDDAMRSHHQRSGERHKISSDVGGKQSLQAEESRRIDEPAIEA
jgi:hypothetical protein